MTAADLIWSIEAECSRLGVSPDSIEVQLDDEPSRPVLAVGHATRFDGHLTIEITANDYPFLAFSDDSSNPARCICPGGADKHAQCLAASCLCKYQPRAAPAPPGNGEEGRDGE